MVMSSAVVTWLVLVIVIPVLGGSLGSGVKGALPLLPAVSSRWRRAAGASGVLLHFFIGGSIVSLPFPVIGCGVSTRVGQCPPQPPPWWPVPKPPLVFSVSVTTAKSGPKDTRARLVALGLGCIWRGRPPQFSQCQCSISEIVSFASWDPAEK